jgi:hypothetical protein
MNICRRFNPVEYLGFFIRWLILTVSGNLRNSEFETFEGFKKRRKYFLDFIIGFIAIVAIGIIISPFFLN